jgi:DNA-directed RNA polymerase subunit F
MAEQTSARLWDLRAQAESFLRRLTRAHQYLERYKEHDPEALADLRNEFKAIVSTAQVLSDAARDAEAHVAELPERHVRARATGT